MQSQNKPKRSTEIWKQDSDGSVVVLGNSKTHRLNDVAAFIWTFLDGSNTIERIVVEVCDHFQGAMVEVVSRDVDTLLARFDKDDLILPNYNSLYPYKDATTIK